MHALIKGDSKNARILPTMARLPPTARFPSAWLRRHPLATTLPATVSRQSNRSALSWEATGLGGGSPCPTSHPRPCSAVPRPTTVTTASPAACHWVAPRCARVGSLVPPRTGGHLFLNIPLDPVHVARHASSRLAFLTLSRHPRRCTRLLPLTLPLTSGWDGAQAQAPPPKDHCGAHC